MHHAVLYILWYLLRSASIHAWGMPVAVALLWKFFLVLQLGLSFKWWQVRLIHTWIEFCDIKIVYLKVQFLTSMSFSSQSTYTNHAKFTKRVNISISREFTILPGDANESNKSGVVWPRIKDGQLLVCSYSLGINLAWDKEPVPG